MSNGGWDKRQWESFQEVLVVEPDGQVALKVANSYNILGVGPHDYVQYSYSAAGDIADIDYFIGAAQAAGTLVASVHYEYNTAGNVTSIERRFPV